MTPGGIFSERYLRNAIEVIGADQVMFAVDYPFKLEKDAKSFLVDADIPGREKEMIAHANWERLTAR